MVELLGDDFEFLIVTRDRDFKATKPYSNVNVNNWNRVGKAQVFYASPNKLNIAGVKRLLTDTPHDVLYLNSFLSPTMTGLPLLVRRLGLYGNNPIVLAPRGEFSAGALALKSTKKQAYVAFAKMTGLYRKLIWQASSEFEEHDIKRALGGTASDIRIAPNLLPRPTAENVRSNYQNKCSREPGPLRILFLSRISPMKNLDFLLRVLGNVVTPVQFTIFGPAEDAAYWSTCKALIRALPRHIAVTHAGEITHAQVPETFANHDVFIFPTRGENFGHVIFESLSAGTSVIVSDQTPWQTDSHGAVEVFSLLNMSAWVNAIERWASFNDVTFSTQREAAVNYATIYVEASKALEQNRQMFLSANLSTTR
jgi:glycosyltransferase involved in cell wall biosynthesis